MDMLALRASAVSVANIIASRASARASRRDVTRCMGRVLPVRSGRDGAHNYRSHSR